MIAKIFFLVSVLKGLDAYPKPTFWAVLYTLFAFVSVDIFSLAGGADPLPIVGWTVVNLVLSYVYFTALGALDGLVYWAVFAIGLFGLSWI